jgi:hypothetical protein
MKSRTEFNQLLTEEKWYLNLKQENKNPVEWIDKLINVMNDWINRWNEQYEEAKSIMKRGNDKFLKKKKTWTEIIRSWRLNKEKI